MACDSFPCRFGSCCSSLARRALRLRLRLRLGLGLVRSFASVDNVHSAPVARPLQPGGDDDAASDVGNSLLAPLLAQAPHRREIDDVPGCPARGRAPGLAAHDETPAPRRAYESGRVGDEVPARRRIGARHARRVAQLQPDAPLHGGRERAVPQHEAQPLRHVQRDQIALERRAGLLERLFVHGPHGEDVVLACELAEAGRRGGLAHEQRAAAEDV